jgi:hypothetical protein
VIFDPIECGRDIEAAFAEPGLGVGRFIAIAGLRANSINESAFCSSEKNWKVRENLARSCVPQILHITQVMLVLGANYDIGPRFMSDAISS